MANYSIPDREAHWQQFWSDHKTYAFDPTDTSRPTYTIDTPPPTVSGQLHIGHIFSYTQAEIIARVKRMTGHNVYYPIGFDDNGIPTELLVQKELGDQAKDMDRKTFVNACLEVTAKYRELYKSLWKSLGMSFDRNMTYSTISPFVQQIAQQRFLELYQKGAIIHKEFPALWDRANQTTIAQAETEEKEEDAFFSEVSFDVDGGGEIIIATTRPELMPACVAVFVHPEDVKYKNLVGKIATTPFGHKVQILTDDKVKMDKGTGAVMCCSYGDETDMYRIQKYKLNERIIVGKDGRIHNSGVEEIENLKPKQARAAIIPLLEESGKLVKHTPIRQGIVYSERGKVPVEIIPVTQWFIDITSIKDQLINYGQEMNFLPEHMEKRYDDRINNLEWNRNISRSRNFGIPLPVRYSKKTGEIILPSSDQLPLDPLTDIPKNLPDGHTLDDIIPEMMVLDTWFTSGLSPEINKAIMKTHGTTNIPDIFSLRPQAHDIIRTRLLYTTVQSHYDKQQKPFEQVMISGHVLASKGEKISKSKDNAKFGPESLLEQFGADAVRYRSASGQLGKDMAFEEKELKNGQKLITKIWNVCQFVKLHIQEGGTTQQDTSLDTSKLYPTDQRILSRLNITIAKVMKAYENYEVGLAKIAFEEFFWHDFCDNYLEIIKNRLYKPETVENGEELKKSAQIALSECFRAILRLIAPIVPHISEELYQDIFKSQYNFDSIHLTPLPSSIISEAISLDDMLRIISDVRGYKTSHQLSLGAEIQKLTIFGPQSLLDQIKEFEIDILGVAKAQEINYKLDSTYHIEITQ